MLFLSTNRVLYSNLRFNYIMIYLIRKAPVYLIYQSKMNSKQFFIQARLLLTCLNYYSIFFFLKIAILFPHIIHNNLLYILYNPLFLVFFFFIVFQVHKKNRNGERSNNN